MPRHPQQLSPAATRAWMMDSARVRPRVHGRTRLLQVSKTDAHAQGTEYKHTPVHTHIHTHAHTCTRHTSYTCAHTHIHMQTHWCPRAHACTHWCTPTRIRAPSCTHVHTHMCTVPRSHLLPALTLQVEISQMKPQGSSPGVWSSSCQDGRAGQAGKQGGGPVWGCQAVSPGLSLVGCCWGKKGFLDPLNILPH